MSPNKLRTEHAAKPNYQIWVVVGRMKWHGICCVGDGANCTNTDSIKVRFPLDVQVFNVADYFESVSALRLKQFALDLQCAMLSRLSGGVRLFLCTAFATAVRHTISSAGDSNSDGDLPCASIFMCSDTN